MVSALVVLSLAQDAAAYFNCEVGAVAEVNTLETGRMVALLIIDDISVRVTVGFTAASHGS